jgi:hypothetical protein
MSARRGGLFRIGREKDAAAPEIGRGRPPLFAAFGPVYQGGSSPPRCR